MYSEEERKRETFDQALALATNIENKPQSHNRTNFGNFFDIHLLKIAADRLADEGPSDGYFNDDECLVIQSAIFVGKGQLIEEIRKFSEMFLEFPVLLFIIPIVVSIPISILGLMVSLPKTPQGFVWAAQFISVLGGPFLLWMLIAFSLDIKRAYDRLQRYSDSLAEFGGRSADDLLKSKPIR
jgi:hypothetical protein